MNVMKYKFAVALMFGLLTIVGCDGPPSDHIYYGAWGFTDNYCDLSGVYPVCDVIIAPGACAGHTVIQSIGVNAEGNRLYLDGVISGMSTVGNVVTNDTSTVSFAIDFVRGTMNRQIIVEPSTHPGCYVHYQR